MNWATAVVLIVLISAIAGVLRARHGSAGRSRRPGRRDGNEDTVQPGKPTAREQALESEVSELRERIQVLERIATDPARRTAEAIEKLRDER